MIIWIDDRPHEARPHSTRGDGYQTVLMHQNGVPVAEHTLPDYFLKSPNVTRIITGGRIYSKEPPHVHP